MSNTEATCVSTVRTHHGITRDNYNWLNLNLRSGPQAEITVTARSVGQLMTELGRFCAP